jgi:tRNA (guanine37-N1)-methyltransferase
MEQEKLEERVREIWENQDFEFSGETPFFTAENDEKFSIGVFSSEKYSPEEVEGQAEEINHVFIDEGFEDLDVGSSVIRERDDQDYDMPSFEIIGDIAVINDLAGRDSEESVRAIEDNHPFVETVLLKEEGLSGEFRVGEYRKLQGDKTETVHTEHGCLFKVDPTRVYYSERYSTERERVVAQIEDGEDVLVMFAGVGPFAIMAARNANPGRVVAVEKNPDAYEYLEENIEMNDVEETVEAYEGDVDDIVPDLGEFDRIIMPLPGSADEYLELASQHLRENGTVYYYRFVEDNPREFIREELEELDVGLEYFSHHSSGSRSPSTRRICFELTRK